MKNWIDVVESGTKTAAFLVQKVHQFFVLREHVKMH